MPKSKAKDVDGYIASFSADTQAALQDLRARIQRIAPDAVEGISYGIPVFKLRGHPLVGFGSAKAHCSFFVMSVEVLDAHADRVAGYSTGRGTVRFAPDSRLPEDLVASLVKARVAEVDSHWPA